MTIEINMGALPLEVTLARAEVAWPGVHVDARRFAEFIAGRTVDDELRTDLVLACACLDGEPAALSLFEERLFAPVASRLRSTMGASVAEETIGRLRESLFVGPSPKLATYSGRGDLRGWLEVVATREAYKVARKEPTPGDDHILASLPDDDDLELRHIKAQHRSELGRAFAEALASLPPRERLLLRQRYLDGLTFDEVAVLHNVHRITVMRWMARIERSLLKEIRRVLVSRLGLETAEVEHLVDDARSRLDISLRGLLSVAVAFVLASSGVARADKATSLDHYNKGKTAYAAASFETAIAEFELAYKEMPAPEYLHDIAQAYRRLDKSCDALAYFEKYLAGKPAAKNRAEVEQHIVALKPKCAPPAATPTPASTPTAPPAPVVVAEASAPVAAPRVATVVEPSQTRIVGRVATTRPSPYSVAVAGGVVLLDAGPVVMPPIGQLDASVRRRFGGAYDLHAGAGISLARLPYDDMKSGTVWLAGPQLTVDAAYAVHPKLSLIGGAALGAIVISGLGAGNPFTTDNMSSDAVITARAKAELGVAWCASDRVTVRVLPAGYQWSPARGKLADDIDALHGFTMSAGLAVAW
ncbi:MAG: sigma-70 family RNA polymerase sigma factor [Myxococcota bacterium]|nr:sigma-70 family RNA polymerase sigma factor [Myxococcota bacterium]